MAKIKIVTHCWAVENPQYAVFLQFQLSSLLNHPSAKGHEITPVVVMDSHDEITKRVVSVYSCMVGKVWPHVVQLPKTQVWRRSIGRNIVAKEDVNSDLIWFTDCDYLFEDTCLDLLFEEWLYHGTPDMIWPEEYAAAGSKSDVDSAVREILKYRVQGVVSMPRDADHPMRLRKAIGGVQIVSGEYARAKGYLDAWPKWQAPVSTPFPDFRDDVRFRKELEAHGRSVAIPHLPGLRRMRHTEIGYGLP